jgi:hypothetical protein
VPNRYWRSRKNRANAVRWLADALGKEPGGLKVRDFHRNGLTALAYCYSTRKCASVMGMEKLFDACPGFAPRLAADTGVRG